MHSARFAYLYNKMISIWKYIFASLIRTSVFADHRSRKKCFSWLGVSAIVGVQCEVPRAVLLGCKSLNIFAKGFFWASSYHHVFLGTSTAGFVCCACYMHCILCPELHWSVINDHVAAVIWANIVTPGMEWVKTCWCLAKKKKCKTKSNFFLESCKITENISWTQF